MKPANACAAPLLLHGLKPIGAGTPHHALLNHVERLPKRIPAILAALGLQQEGRANRSTFGGGIAKREGTTGKGVPLLLREGLLPKGFNPAADAVRIVGYLLGCIHHLINGAM